VETPVMARLTQIERKPDAVLTQLSSGYNGGAR
jgi:hypothetical protein